MRPTTPDWVPQMRHEWQRPWGWDRPVDLDRLRQAIWLDCENIGGPHHFIVREPELRSVPVAGLPQLHVVAPGSGGALVSFHPRRPLDAPPCECSDWQAGHLCAHVLCVLLHVGDREVVQALRELVPAPAGGG